MSEDWFSKALSNKSGVKVFNFPLPVTDQTYLSQVNFGQSSSLTELNSSLV